MVPKAGYVHQKDLQIIQASKLTAFRKQTSKKVYHKILGQDFKE